VSTTTEETVRQEQEEHDSASQFDNDSPAPENDGLFDRSQYDSPELALSKIGGQPIDRIAVKFAGTVFLDRSDPADVALYRRLQLGHDLTLMVETKVAAVAGKGATDREGDLDVVVGESTLKVHTVYKPVTDDTAD
jgi:hypothetical protein